MQAEPDKLARAIKKSSEHTTIFQTVTALYISPKMSIEINCKHEAGKH